MEFKDRLRFLREEKELSAAQLAGEFGKSEGAIRMWETGKSKPDADTLIALSKYFNCTTDYLLGLSNNKNEDEKETKERSFDSLIYLIDSLPTMERNSFISSFSFLVDSYKKLLLIKQPYIASETKAYLGAFSYCIETAAEILEVMIGRAPSDQKAKDAIALKYYRSVDDCNIIFGGIQKAIKTAIESIPAEKADSTLVD